MEMSSRGSAKEVWVEDLLYEARKRRGILGNFGIYHFGVPRPRNVEEIRAAGAGNRLEGAMSEGAFIVSVLVLAAVFVVCVIFAIGSSVSWLARWALGRSRK